MSDSNSIPKVLAGNWKLHKDPHSTLEFLSQWQKMNSELLLEAKSRNKAPLACQQFFFIPATQLETAARFLKTLENQNIHCGAQNFFYEDQGAFTGEISARTLSTMGVSHALVGHSERREIFLESNDWISKKVASALRNRVNPLICVGEKWAQRQAGQTWTVIEEQLESAFKAVLKPEDLHQVRLAYEPVWSIGTGQVASSEQVKEVHLMIRNWLIQKWGDADARRVPILYGGSVKPENAAELALVPNVNGFLVGGASLDVKTLFEILLKLIT
jgi:triosephosphate isomerase